MRAEPCEACELGKSSRQSVPTAPVERRLVVGAKLHVDLAGPFPPSVTGAKYLFGVTDDASGYTWMVPMRTKDQATASLESVLQELHGLGVKFPPGALLQADNDSVFRDKRFVALLNSNGLTLITSPPYTPSKNGYAERRWRSVLELARVMLIDARLPRRFWAAAAIHATLIRNITSVSASDDSKSPYEIIRQRPFDLALLHPFGARAYVHDHRPDGKLAAKARVATYVGHHLMNQCPLVLLPDARRPVEAFHVRVDHGRLGPASEEEESSAGIAGRRRKEEQEDDGQVWLTAVAPPVPGVVAPPTGAVPVQPVPTVFDGLVNDDDGDVPVPPAPANATPAPVQQALAPAPQLPPTRPGPAQGKNVYIVDKIIDERVVKRRGQNVTELRVVWLGYPEAEATWETRTNLHKTDAFREWEAAKANELVPAAVEEEHDVVLMASVPREESVEGDPTTIEEALASPHQQEWRASIHEEVAALKAMGTWTEVERSKLPPGVKVLTCKFVFKTKRDVHGKIVKFKCRLVARGCQEGSDGTSNYAPVVSRTTTRMALAVAAAEGLLVDQIDVSTAFLNGEIDGEVYVELPSVPELGLAPQVCRLNRTLYGLRQSPRRWNETFHTAIQKAGLKRSSVDPCLYVHQDPAVRLFLILYVDDILLFAKEKEDMSKVKETLQEHFETRDLGPSSGFVGMEIRRDESGGILLTQEHYVRELTERFGLGKSKAMNTPLPSTWTLEGALKSQALDRAQADEYRTIVGGLLYLSCGTRPDLAFAMSQLSQCVSQPTTVSLHAARHVLKYLSATPSLALRYGQHQPLTAWVDATWASAPQARSITGYVVLYNGAAVAWRSHKQPTVARSSCEAEYSALGDVCAEIEFLIQLLGALGLPTTNVVVKEDNQAAIHLASNPETTNRTKHFDVSYHVSRDLVDRGIITLQYVESAEQLADSFTKHLGGDKFKQHRLQVFG